MASDFPKSRRLLSGKEYSRVLRGADRKVVTGSTVFFLLRHESHVLGSARLGLIVSKKVGNARHRNVVKRWLRESFRQCEQLSGFDMVAIARRGSSEMSYAQIERHLRKALRKADFEGAVVDQAPRNAVAKSFAVGSRL